MPSAREHHNDPSTEPYQMEPAADHHQVGSLTEQHQMDPSAQSDPSTEQHQMDPFAQQWQVTSSERHQMDLFPLQHQMVPLSVQHQMESSTEQHETNPSTEQHQMNSSTEEHHIVSSTEQHQMSPSTEQRHIEPSTENHHIEPSAERHDIETSIEKHHIEPSTEQQASSTSLQQEANEVPLASSTSQQTEGPQLDGVDMAKHATETLSSQLADDKIEPYVAEEGKPVTCEETAGVSKTAALEEILGSSTEGATARESTTFAQLLPSSPKIRRAEIDTAAPFESVKAAVSLFGERMDWKSQLRPPQLQTSSVERRMVSEPDLHKVQEDLAYYKEQFSLTKASTAGVLLQLEKVKELIQGSARTLEGTDILDYQRVPLHKAAEVAETPKNTAAAVMDKHATVELQTILREIEGVEEELLSTRASKEVAVEGLQNAVTFQSTVSKRVDELAEEQASLNEAVAAAQVALVDAEEQVELLRSGHKAELQDKVPNNFMERKSAEIKGLESKLEEANAMVMKLKEELTASKGVENTAVVAATEAHDTIQKVKVELEHAKSEELGTVGELGKVLEGLDELKAKLEKATEDSSTLSSAILVLKSDTERGRMELDSMHEKEQTACAMLASLQDELHKVKESLVSAQEGEARAVEAKEALPAAIKQAASEADEAKAAAEASKEEAHKARHEMEQVKATTSTAISRQQAALKESEAARASESMALAEFKALTESEAQGADMESESEGGTGVTISLEEYSSLKQAAHEAKDLADKKVAGVLAQVEEAKTSQLGTQSRLDGAVKEAEMGRDKMLKAQKTAEDAQQAKLAVEGELRKWRAELDQRRKAGNAPELKMGTAQSSQRKLSSDEEAAKVVTQGKGMPPSFQEKTVVGLDSLAQVLSLKVPTPERLGRLLPLEDLTKEKEKIKKKTFIRRLASIVVRKKSHSAVLT